MLNEKSYFSDTEECILTPQLILLILKNYYVCDACNGEKLICEKCDNHGILMHDELIFDSLFRE
ncbi:hypothetical protein BWI86_28590 (plasmid) [Escherichia coli]|nr:hypothetical protein BWI86_28510 [Escherichia coli]AUY94297.1 hypothetical protein BWI86_28550 [Escherichia coli]AUY94301.1 hypothetical protein BWI86_28590 [Escherichia coli]